MVIKFSRAFIRLILQAIIIGIIASATMDVWNLVLWVTLGIDLDWSLLGRWIGHTLQGDFMLYGVNATSVIQHESILGWVGHYTTGIMYAFCYLFIAKYVIHHSPSLLLAIIISLCFMVMPFLVYQPAIELGYFASQAETPNFVRLVTVSMHTFFGVGLYLGYLLVHRWFK